METRIGWNRALLAAEQHDVTVLCGPGATREELLTLAGEAAEEGRLDFQPVLHNAFGAWCCTWGALFYVGYRMWQAKAFRLAKQLHAERPFDLVHQVTFCGYREPGHAWKLGIPFVWGPVGGTQSFPLTYLRYTSVPAGIREVVRNAVNEFQLRYSPKVRRAAASASQVFSATRRANRDLKRGLGIDSEVMLETGLDCEIGPERPVRDASQPLRILWAGRLRDWKGLPLLLHAVSQLPEDCAVQVRVLGTGFSKRRWKKLAEKLGLAEKVEWVEWPEYQATLPHYQWADVFAFTSLRDTSGTGLIESLAAGTPIIGLDHQGAADIMNRDCAMPIPVGRPEETIARFAEAIESAAKEPEKLHQLSQSAQTHARSFDWRAANAVINRTYAAAVKTCCTVPIPTGDADQSESREPKPGLSQDRNRTTTSISAAGEDSSPQILSVS